MKKEILEKYAKLAVEVGCNVQEGQIMVINSSVDCKEFTRYVVEAAYKAKAKEVIVKWNDDICSKYTYMYADESTLCDIPNYLIEQANYFVDQKVCLLSIYAPNPGLLKDIDGNKLQKAAIARNKALKKFQEYTMGNKGQWSIVSIPTISWAQKVFPNDSEEEAVRKLWDAILMSVRVDENNDPVLEWKKHNENLAAREKVLNDKQFDYLHFKSSNGTDFTIKLVDNHIWAGGCEKTTSGVVFNPNLPTEEVFTMPYKYGVNGRVVSTKPLNYQGKLIEDFYLDFKDGKVVNYDAKKEKDALKNLIEFDEGSCYLGEVALVGYNSPINNTNILFLNTLFDENASCHLALGRAYPMNVKGGTEMSQEELDKIGSNNSMEHEDFMIGSKDLEIVGYTKNNESFMIFKDGDWCF